MTGALAAFVEMDAAQRARVMETVGREIEPVVRSHVQGRALEMPTFAFIGLGHA